MSFKKNDHRYDFEVHCPYNKKHQMPYSRLWFHLSQGCNDKRNKGHRYSICPYNVLHILRNEAYDGHIQRCKNRPKNNGDEDLFRQMQQAINNQFGGQESSQAVSNITQLENDMPVWSEAFQQNDDTVSEQDDVDNINAIAILNESIEEEERKRGGRKSHNDNNSSVSFHSSFESNSEK